MAEEAPAAPAKTKAVKKRAPRAKAVGTPLPKLIVAAVAESKEKKGTSLSAIKKLLSAKGVDVLKGNKRINATVTRLVGKGILKQTKGTGASGSFKLAEKPKAEKKPAKKASKKVIKVKKPAVKKSPKKKAPAKKSPKKAAKKPAAKKSPAKKAAKKAAPKKVVKKTVAKKAVKKPAAKKAPAKKAAAKKGKK